MQSLEEWFEHLKRFDFTEDQQQAAKKDQPATRPAPTDERSRDQRPSAPLQTAQTQTSPQATQTRPHPTDIRSKGATGPLTRPSAPIGNPSGRLGAKPSGVVRQTSVGRLPSVVQTSQTVPPTFRSVPAPTIAPKPQAPSTGSTRPLGRQLTSTAYGVPAINAPRPRQKPLMPVQKETREQLLSRLLDPVLTLEEAAQVLNVCPTTVRRYTNKGLLEHYRTTGNQRRFRLSHVLNFLGEAGGSLGSSKSERPSSQDAIVSTRSENPRGRSVDKAVRSQFRKGSALS